jgi:hypothetical protein
LATTMAMTAASTNSVPAPVSDWRKVLSFNVVGIGVSGRRRR